MRLRDRVAWLAVTGLIVGSTFLQGFAGAQNIFGINRRKIAIARQLKVQATVGSIVIADGEMALNVSSEFVAILVKSEYRKARVFGRQFSNAILWYVSEYSSKNRIASDYSTLAMPRHTPVFGLRSRHSLKWMCVIQPARFDITTQKLYRVSTPRKLSWDMTTVLEIKNKLGILFSVFGHNKLGNGNRLFVQS